MVKTKQHLKVYVPQVALNLLPHAVDNNTPLFCLPKNDYANERLALWIKDAGIEKKITYHVSSHSKFFYLLNISELSILKNVTANDLETSYILFLSQLCNIQRTL